VAYDTKPSLTKEEAMEFMKRLEPLWLLLVVIGAINWLMVGLFDTNVVTEIVGSGTASDVIYVIVGIAGLALVPRLLAELRLGAGRTHVA
jgi:uncharacterized protein